jgi:hypothetical protein
MVHNKRNDNTRFDFYGKCVCDLIKCITEESYLAMVVTVKIHRKDYKWVEKFKGQ